MSETPDETPARPGGDPTSIVQRQAGTNGSERDSVENPAPRVIDGGDVDGGGTVTVAETLPEPAAVPGGETADEAAATGWSRRSVAAIAAVLVLAGAVLQVLAWRGRHEGAGHDQALVDAETTSVVIGDVSNGLSKIFSYAPGSTAATEQAATDVLAGTAASQYHTLFAQVKQRAAAERLTVTTHVVRAGVTRLSGDTAQLLVFLDQDIVRKDKPDGTAVAAQLSVTARRSAGHWRIVDIHAR